AVEDRAATGGYLDRLALLLRGHRRVGVAVDDLDPRRAHEGDREQADEGQDEEADPRVRPLLVLHRCSRRSVVALGSASTRPSFDAASVSMRAFADALESCALVDAISALSSARSWRRSSSCTLRRRTRTLTATTPASRAATSTIQRTPPVNAERPERARRARRSAGCAIVDIRPSPRRAGAPRRPVGWRPSRASPAARACA